MGPRSGRRMQDEIQHMGSIIKDMKYLLAHRILLFSWQSYEVWIIISKLNMVKLSSREGNLPKIIAVCRQRQVLKPCLCGITIYSITIYALFVESPTSSSISLIEYITTGQPTIPQSYCLSGCDSELTVLWFYGEGVVQSEARSIHLCEARKG